LNAAYKALRPGGVLAVWSSGTNAAFSKRLRGAGFDVNEVAIRATGKGVGARHVIWIATKGK
jgi:spermidine synthase